MNPLAPQAEIRRADDSLLRLVPPHSLEAERAVLGACLLEASRAFDAVSGVLLPQDFYRPAHEAVFRAMGALRAKGDALDAVSLVAALRSSGALDDIGGPAEVGALLSVVPSAANALYHAKIVKEASRLRAAEVALVRAREAIHDKGAPVAERLALADRIVHEATREGYVGSGPASADSALSEMWRVARGAAPRTIPSGVRRLDELTLGFPRKEITILGGRPGAGKSSIALAFAQAAASPETGLSVGLWSLEMEKVVLAQKLVAGRAEVSMDVLRGGYHWHHDLEEKLNNAGEEVAALRLWIDDTAALSLTQLRAAARALKAEQGLDLLVLDYLQLMEAPDEPKQKRRHEVLAGITRGLKALAQELDVALVACAALNRNVEDRHGGKPRLSDLREGGTQEQDAAVVLLIHSEESKEGEEGFGDKEVGLVVAKNRFGPTGEVKIMFDKRTGRVA